MRSAKKTSPIAFAGKPNEYAITVVTIEAIILQDIALSKLLVFVSDAIFFFKKLHNNI